MTTARRLPSWLKAKMPGSKNYIEVNNLVKTLQKKGFKKEATNVANAYMKSMRAFNNELDDIIRGLM